MRYFSHYNLDMCFAFSTVMGSVSKRQNLSEEAKLAEEIDRISNLPDSILCHVLSFLPTKYAVGTTILSTKWKYLFSSLPNLDFDDSLLLHPQQGSENQVDHTTFMNFVDRVLNLCDAPHINRFRLKCNSCEVARVNAWISAAVLQKVEELELCIFPKDLARLPHGLFTLETLVVLKLGGNFEWNVPAMCHLPNLKKLHLDRIVLGDQSTQKLICNCPVLEHLAILGCCWVDVSTFNIFAPALKSLIINCLLENGYSTEFCAYEIVIDAPNLLYLKYIDYVPESFSVKNLQSLFEAHIDVGLSSEQEQSYDYVHHSYDILKGISKVQFLHLSSDFMEALALPPWFLCEFPKLTRLELGVNHRVGWRVLPELLQNSPLLETLVFMEGLLDRECEHETQWWHPADPPSCMLFHLKAIRIKFYQGKIRELNMVKYFLNNAKVLKYFSVHTYGVDERRVSNIRKKILTLPRASMACEVAII